MSTTANASRTDGAGSGTPDLEGLRARYRHERDRRLQPAGRRGEQVGGSDFAYYVTDPWTPREERGPRTDDVDAVVVGSGFGGLLTAVALRRAGIGRVRLVDEAGGVGGTWYWNRYPGIHCDIEASVYLPLLEETGTVPSMRYAPGEEIRQHAVAIAQRYGLHDDALFHTRTTGLRWRDDDSWEVTTDRGDAFRARYVVVSSGTLTKPKLPAVPGMQDFRGHTFHTSRWDYGYTGGSPDGDLDGLRDKVVGVVGTGATGVQVIPHLARSAKHLVVFQRTPSSVDVRDNHPTGTAWYSAQPAGWQRERQENFLASVTGEEVATDLVRDSWTASAAVQRTYLGGRRAASSPEAEREVEVLDALTMERIRRRVDENVGDPRTAELLKPWYRYMCKRPTFSDEYLPVFDRDDVTLVDTADTGGITRMTQDAAVVGEEEFPLDCLVFATGFDVGVSGVVSGTLPVLGRGGTPLLQAWGAGPRTLHGFYSPGFPNLFHLGSLQNAASVNFVHLLQEQAEHIGVVVQAAEAAGALVEPSGTAADAWAAHLEEVSDDTEEFQRECTPGYYNGEGRVHRIRSYSPGPVRFHRLLRDWRRDHLDEVLVAPGTAGPGAS